MDVAAPLMHDEGGPDDVPLLGESAAMRRVRAFVEETAALDSPVLVTGESGTGKELVARALHARSPRRAAPFVALDVSVPGEGDPFAAAAERGGTLFLHEIAGMSKALQVTLLHALETLQERRGIRRVGSDGPELRIVCASDADLQAEVSNGSFRRDLYHRIDVHHLELPPLRVRDDDVLVLARHFLAQHAARVGKHLTGFTDAATHALRAWSWPGNVRELESCIEHAVGLARGNDVDVENIPARIRRGVAQLAQQSSTTASTASTATSSTSASTATSGATSAASATSADGDLVRLEDVVRRHVLKVLQMTGGNRRHAAKLLGISRRTLYRRLDEWNLTHDET
jgi:DNA-binding NtrC family response regulator